MEKHGWKERLGDHMINAYSAVKPLTDKEVEYIKLRLLYPEKFWKIVNFYYNNRKVWVPDKVCEKLGKLIQAEDAREEFLEYLSSMLLGK